METRRLYYEDSHLAEFRAVVTGCTQKDRIYEVTLDATAFYPEGGGQAGDTGRLGAASVLDTRECGGLILHICDQPLEPGIPVQGRIDYEARFARMQQHSGEHIVSGILHRMFGCSNTGFHMGSDRITIDFDAVIPADRLPEIELEANRAVWLDIPVKIWTPAPDELAQLAYRTKRALDWPVRIVDIPGYDRCACCGTHVARTGEIGLVKLFSAIPFRGGTRIEMACGIQAMAQLDLYYRQCLEVSHICSVPAAEAGDGAKQLAEQLAETKYRLISMRRQRTADIAARLTGKGNILCMEDGLDGTSLRELAEAIAGTCGGIAAVFSRNDSGTCGYCLAAPGQDLRPLGKELNTVLCGKGGGKPAFQQGSAKADDGQIRSFFAQHGFGE